MRTLRGSFLLLSLSLVGCPTPAPVGTDAALGDAGAGDDGGPPDGGGSACAPATVACIDQSISMLDLFDTISPAAITEEGTTAGEFLSFVDATGGGFMPTDAFVYARFTDTGLEKVDITDEDAFTSVAWDVAFRRFIIRLNSGVSGPSCVTAARTGPGTTFEDVTALPDGLTQRTEEYLTEGTCDLVPDGSGLPGAPSSALSSFWTYPGCVSMTHNVYVITLASGRHVRFEVESYYPPDNQASCDTTGMVTMPSGAGNVRVRWAFLD